MQSTSLNMQRKSGFPVANSSIKMPDRPPETALISDGNTLEEDHEHQQKRQLLINFGHSQWGFNNWSWAVTKQELDFVEMTNGKYSAGVVAFVSVTVKSFDIHRENIGYATSNASSKGFAIYKSRKCAVTNALRETLLSFGGTVATELLDLLESQKPDLPAPPAPRPPDVENNPNVANHPTEIKNLPQNTPKNPRKEDVGVGTCAANRLQHAAPPKNAPANAPRSPPTARAVPTVPRVPRPPLVRPNSNEAKLEGMTEEEARAERKRRQRLAQEEFRLKQLMKNGTDDKQELEKNSSSLDKLMMEIPTQDIVIEETGCSGDKRKSPQHDGSASKRRASFSRLDVKTE